jgi:hypothetical protein
VFLFIYKSLSGAAISSKIWASQARKKFPSQAINGKLLSILFNMVGEKTRSALRREQGHLLSCCQHLTTEEFLFSLYVFGKPAVNFS